MKRRTTTWVHLRPAGGALATMVAVGLLASIAGAQPRDGAGGMERRPPPDRPRWAEPPHPPEGPGQRPMVQPLSDEEYERATAFIRENMPTVHEIWSRLPEGVRERRMLPPRLAGALRVMMDAEDRDDQELADLLARQMRLRDEFLGDLIDRIRSGENRPQIREGLREKTREIVMANLEQRELRLRQMEQRLEQERQKLAHDRDNPESLLEGQLQSMMEESQFFLRAFRRQAGVATRPADPPEQGGPDRAGSQRE